MRRIFILFVFIAVYHFLSAQDNTDCGQVLSHAEDEFVVGRFYSIPALLKPCLDNNRLTNEQQVRAYLLLTQAYLLIDDPIGAENSYLNLLKADPEYIATPEKDPIDVYYLSKKFTSTPIFTPTLVRFGGNTSFVRTIYDTDPYSTLVDRKNILKPGVNVGTGIDFNYNDNISIGGEINFSRKSFKTSIRAIFGEDESNVVERQNWLDFPLYLKYQDNLGKIRPFGYAGYAINLLISSKTEDTYVNRLTSPATLGNDITSDGPDVDLVYKRNFLNTSLVFGGGVKYKIGKNFLFAELRYMVGFSNLTNAKFNYYDSKDEADPQLAITTTFYNHIGDLFKLDNISLSFGYIRPLYNPRKLKKARNKGALKEISKDTEQ